MSAVTSSPSVEQDGITVSSTYIRTLVAQGEIERANEFLGHPYTLSDRVSHGKKLGTTLGFPTVNLKLERERPRPPPRASMPPRSSWKTATPTWP